MKTKMLFTIIALALGASSASIATHKLEYDVVRCYQPENGETHYIFTYPYGDVRITGGRTARHIETTAQTCKDNHGDKEVAHGHARVTPIDGSVSYQIVSVARPKNHQAMAEYDIIITRTPDGQHSAVTKHALHCKHEH